VTIRLDEGRAHISEFEALLHHGFGDAEPRGDIGGRHSALDQRLERVEFVGGVHRFPLDVLGKADFRGVGLIAEDVARNTHVCLDGSGPGEGF